MRLRFGSKITTECSRNKWEQDSFRILSRFSLSVPPSVSFPSQPSHPRPQPEAEGCSLPGSRSVSPMLNGKYTELGSQQGLSEY